MEFVSYEEYLKARNDIVVGGCTTRVNLTDSGVFYVTYTTARNDAFYEVTDEGDTRVLEYKMPIPEVLQSSGHKEWK